MSPHDIERIIRLNQAVLYYQLMGAHFMAFCLRKELEKMK